MTTKRVLVLGGVSWNLMLYVSAFPEPKPHTVFTQRAHDTIGSTGAGKVLNLHRLGLDVTLHALIGEDEYGRKVCDYLAQEQIRFMYDIDPAGTQRHVNLMTPDGKRMSIYVEPGTFAPQVDWLRLEEQIAGHDYIVVNIRNYCREALPLLQQQGKDVWCDLHDYNGRDAYHRDFITASDYLLFSSDQMPNYRPFMEAFMEAGKKLIVCTHGREGATALTAKGTWIEVPIIAAYNAQCQDTNGAGDAFFSGLLYGHLLGYTPETCLRLGAIVSGMCVTSAELAAPELSETAVAAAYKNYYGTAPD